MPKGSPVQALYELCRKTFVSSGTVASPLEIRRITTLMDSIRPEDVGLSDINLDDERGHGFFGRDLFRNFPSTRTARWSLPITYLHIYECENFTIGIFCLPTSSVIPLHDHPGMTVLSKILYGSMHVKAYDWIEPACMQSNGQVRLAKLQKDTVLTAPCPTSVLYPKSGGNLHCFTAISSCAVLDVLAPPYSEATGRFCTYYHDYPFSNFRNTTPEGITGINTEEPDEDHAWVARIEAPDDLYIRQGRYNGPSVQVYFPPIVCCFQ
ncbi:unnamed protein product [Spirodela intermedia]|uniref:cysteine dioxygenase n=1 Tax=Spirodela intermedia TaxID=51605 RepID=A0A7I8LEM9_SPIIN|nr:unnamed protein product [Spirodela intermedia]